MRSERKAVLKVCHPLPSRLESVPGQREGKKIALYRSEGEQFSMSSLRMSGCPRSGRAAKRVTNWRVLLTLSFRSTFLLTIGKLCLHQPGSPCARAAPNEPG
ncbi:hypothetical protein RRG08_031348 [Elysia crispata]|uniref:Uncharacterized protein n=1 Tax=Elysia crispata TaxID=231223 RepID=A0AAE1CZB3_9GAST|nr:hypothetical protein RRG08_031348 [Elysia crispata]